MENTTLYVVHGWDSEDGSSRCIGVFDNIVLAKECFQQQVAEEVINLDLEIEWYTLLDETDNEDIKKVISELRNDTIEWLDYSSEYAKLEQKDNGDRTITYQITEKTLNS